MTGKRIIDGLKDALAGRITVKSVEVIHSPILTAIEALERLGSGNYPPDLNDRETCPHDRTRGEGCMVCMEAYAEATATTLRASLAEQEWRMEELRGLSDAAPPGPWNTSEDQRGTLDIEYVDDDSQMVSWVGEYLNPDGARYIVALVNWHRALLQPSPDKGGA